MLAELKDEAARLQKRRHDLALRLAARPHSLQRQLLLEQQQQQAAGVPSPPSDIDLEHVRVEVAAALKRRRVQTEDHLGRLLGQTLVAMPPLRDDHATAAAHLSSSSSSSSAPPPQLGMRLETCYMGRYLERYYVVLKYEKSPSQPRGQVGLLQHTLPHFVPVASLATRHLNVDLKVKITTGRAAIVCACARVW